MNRILRRALALAHAVIEYVRIDDDRVVIGVRPWKAHGLRCPVCGRRCECYDRSPRARSWRALDLARSMCFLEYRTRRVRCPDDGVLVESVPWARHGSRFTRDFESECAWLMTVAGQRTVSGFLHIAWRTAGDIARRVAGRLESSMPCMFDGLRAIGVDETGRMSRDSISGPRRDGEELARTLAARMKEGTVCPEK